MAAEIYTIPQIRQMLMPVFMEYGIRKAVLFGSYGKGIPTEKSDVDILVDSDLHGLKFVGFINQIQQILKKEVDIFDVSHIEPGSVIAKEIGLTGVTVYEE